MVCKFFIKTRVKIPLLQDYKAYVLRENMCLGHSNEPIWGTKWICVGYLEDIRSEMHVIKCMLNFDLRQEVTLEVFT